MFISGRIGCGLFAIALPTAQHGLPLVQVNVGDRCTLFKYRLHLSNWFYLNRPVWGTGPLRYTSNPSMFVHLKYQSAMNQRRGCIPRNSFPKLLRFEAAGFAVVDPIQILTRPFVRHVLIWPILQLRRTSPTRLYSLVSRHDIHVTSGVAVGGRRR